MNKFRRYFLFLFIFLYGFPSEAAHILTFVPDLIEHYNHHNKFHHPIGFIEFIHEHTTESNHKQDQNHNDHEHCPMNHSHSVTVSIGAINSSNEFEFPRQIVFLSESKSNPLPQYSFCHSGYGSLIWQPPRV